MSILAEGGGVDGSVTSLRRWRVFFSGIGARVMWISIGGFVYFGAYEQARLIFNAVVN